MKGTLAHLAIYPLKSGRGVVLTSNPITVRGLRGDREWAAADPKGRLITQRECPALAQVQALEFQGTLRLSTPGQPDLSVHLNDLQKSAGVTCTLWGYPFGARDAGTEASAWLSATLDREARLVRAPTDTGRRAHIGTRKVPLAFPDGNPFHLVNLASVRALRDELGLELDWLHFRPNLVVDGFPAFAEDYWRVIQVGSARFDVYESCARCGILNTTGPQLPPGEPLRGLTRLRRHGKAVLFGQHIALQVDEPDAQLTALTLSVGDPIEVLQVGDEVNPCFAS